MSNNNSSNVSVGKPKVGGAIFTAAVGTTLPTNATGTLVTAFTNVGYCDENGLTDTTTTETSQIKAWGGDVVLEEQTSYGKTYKFTPIETMNLFKKSYSGDVWSSDF